MKESLGNMRIKAVHGGAKGDTTVGLVIDKTSVNDLFRKLKRYKKSKGTKPMNITVFKDNANSNGFHTIVSY